MNVKAILAAKNNWAATSSPSNPPPILRRRRNYSPQHRIGAVLIRGAGGRLVRNIVGA